MILITLRDMQWRARRIVIGVVATALVLAITALLGALHDGFLDETDRTIDFFGADTWIVPSDVSGPFTANSPLDHAAIQSIRSLAGADDVTPVAIFRHVIEGADAAYTDVNVIAYEPGGVVEPRLVSGRAPVTTGEAVVDVRLGVDPGSVIDLAGRRLRVVGTVRDLTYNGGTPTVLITLEEGQLVAFDGRDLATAVVMHDAPSTLPDGLSAMSPAQVRDDLRRPLAVATTAIGIVAGLLWLVAAGIVGMLSFLSGLDRHRDFAVYKAHGVATSRLLVSLLYESVVVSLLAGGLALLLAFGLAPLFPVTISLTLTDGVMLLGLSLLMGIAAGLLSVRGPVRVDPALAFATT